MPSLTPQEAAAALREAVTALSRRLSGEFGDLVPEASAGRTAALLAKLDAGAARIGADDVVTLDSWIRLADSAVLHDDPAEAERRVAIARRLRAVHAAVAPSDGPLAEDPRSD